MASAFAALDRYDEDRIATFIEVAAPTTVAAKAAAVHLATGYYALGAGVRPPALRPRDVGVEPQFREPFISVWQALKNGAPFDDAVLAGSNRTDAMVRNLISGASRATGDLVVKRAGLRTEGFERFADAKACAWCTERDGLIFDSADAADFGHDRCGCSAQPIYA